VQKNELKIKNQTLMFNYFERINSRNNTHQLADF